MMYEDKKIDCIKCGYTFTHYATMQKEYDLRGYDDPKRCYKCRKNKGSTKKDTDAYDRGDPYPGDINLIG